MTKPGLPEGTRDFKPAQVIRRNYIFDSIKKVFTKYGFLPIETPTMEKLSTLMGKYGEEGDRLLFKILNNGDFLAKANKEAIENGNSNKLITSISERGLRYDLTVPFARYVVMHQHEISFPFKRYQIQPVWRADRPQRGRYREFYQCDVDVVGSDSLMYEAELVQIYDEVFSDIGLKVIIKVNNRKVLEGLAEAAGVLEHFVAITVAIDKLDKIGIDGVKKEMTEKGIPNDAISKIENMLSLKNLDELEATLQSSSIGLAGIQELKSFHQYLDLAPTKNQVEFDITLARGLNYYTGCIFEVMVDSEAYGGVKMGSIGGGGRYDNLTSIFGLKDVSGVGVSFGAERIYDLMEELNLFPDLSQNQIKTLILAFDEPTHLLAFQSANQLRAAGIACDVYPDFAAKMKKQMKYANDRNVPSVILIGEEEMASGLLTYKDMHSGEQQKLSLTEIKNLLSN